MYIPNIICGSKTVLYMTCTVHWLLNMRSFLFKCMNVPSPHSEIIDSIVSMVKYSPYLARF